MVRLACDRCGRIGQYHKENLIEQFGGDIVLPDLHHEIARCERRVWEGINSGDAARWQWA